MNFWNEREPREKTLISIAAALIILVIGSQFLVKPILAYPKVTKEAFEKSQANLKIMHSGQSVLQNLPLRTKLNPSEVQSKITKSAFGKGLTITRRQPSGNTGISLWFDSANSIDFYSWLSALTSKYDIYLAKVSIHRNEDGTIRAQLTLDIAP